MGINFARANLGNTNITTRLRVAIVVLTLSAKPERANDWTDNGVYQVTEELQHDLTKVENVALVQIP
jgi:hypothetical protein